MTSGTSVLARNPQTRIQSPAEPRDVPVIWRHGRSGLVPPKATSTPAFFAR